MTVAYKDIQIVNEPSFGASVAFNNSLHIKRVDFPSVFSKQQISNYDTANKGDAESLLQNSQTNGIIEMNATINNLLHSFELVTGSRGITSSVGTSGIQLDFYQQTTGSLKTKQINIDREYSQDRICGVIADSLDLSSAGMNTINLNLNCQARGITGGASINSSIGETLPPFAMGDIHIYVNEGTTYLPSAFELKVSEWRLSYKVPTKALYRWQGENDRSVGRFITEKPTINGSMQVYHEGVSLIPAAYGVSYWYLRIEGTLPEYWGQIAGVTPYKFRIDVPKVTITNNIRKYEQAQMMIEDIAWNGHFESGASLMWKPTIIKAF